MKQLIKKILKEEISFITPKGDTWTTPEDYYNPQDKGVYNKNYNKLKQIIKREFVGRLEDDIKRGGDTRRTVNRFIDIIKKEFSVNPTELSINKKTLLSDIENEASNSRILYRGLTRQGIGKIISIIGSELNKFKSLEDKSNDTDKDGIPNRLDIDDDNDGVLDPNDTDS